jgi:hypothetical protein
LAKRIQTTPLTPSPGGGEGNRELSKTQAREKASLTHTTPTSIQNLYPAKSYIKNNFK